MMRIVTAAALVAFAAGCVTVSQDKVAGSGDVTRVARNVGAFHRIVLNGGPAELHVTAGSPVSVTVAAQPNIAELIETTVANGTLTISRKEQYATDRGVQIAVDVPQLDGVELRGEAGATIAGVHGASLALSIMGAGNVKAAGTVDRLSLESSGAGNADLRDLVAKDAVVRLGGVGNARLDVSSTLDVEISGIGSVKYHGSPRILRQEIHGIGNLSRE